MKIKIREARDADEEAVKSVIASALKDRYGPTAKVDEWKPFNEYKIFYVAEGNGVILGTAGLIEYKKDAPQLKKMYVQPGLQRGGIGSGLFEKIEEYARGKNFRRIVLTTLPEMTAGIDFYKKHGFRIIDEPDLKTKDPSKADIRKKQICMEKIIS